MTYENAITVLEKFVEINQRFEPEIVIEAVKTAIGKLKDGKKLKPWRESLADFNCPRCNNYLSFDGLNESVEEAPSFCPVCGQALDWEELEKGEKRDGN